MVGAGEKICFFIVTRVNLLFICFRTPRQLSRDLEEPLRINCSGDGVRDIKKSVKS